MKVFANPLGCHYRKEPSEPTMLGYPDDDEGTSRALIAAPGAYYARYEVEGADRSFFVKTSSRPCDIMFLGEVIPSLDAALRFGPHIGRVLCCCEIEQRCGSANL
eukprot:6184017-Pleurochrysis_carterae.AAC.2